MRSKFLFYLSLIAVILAFCVVSLGAYTRLTNAGLGCPDWPGCYGKLILPKAEPQLQTAQASFPNQPLELRKAWTEMVHRYAAGGLALIIFFLGMTKLWRKSNVWPPSNLILSLMGLVVFQALLGMWTVTMKLLPVVVMSHLLGGMLIFSLLCCLALSRYPLLAEAKKPALRFFIGLGIGILFCQIALGGWVSSNYAGLACIGFPRCNGLWLPALHFSKGFNLLAPLGINYQGGVLDNEVRVTIQFIHRIGAMITALYLLILALYLCRVSAILIRNLSIAVILLVILQLTLGIINVSYLLPLPVAVAHNGVAALILGLMLMYFYFSKRRVDCAS